MTATRPQRDRRSVKNRGCDKLITNSSLFLCHCYRWRSGFKIVAPRRSECRKRRSRSCGCRRSGSTTPLFTAPIRAFWRLRASTRSGCCPIQASRRTTRSPPSIRPGNEREGWRQRARIGSESICNRLRSVFEYGQATDEGRKTSGSFWNCFWIHLDPGWRRTKWERDRRKKYVESL